MTTVPQSSAGSEFAALRAPAGGGTSGEDRVGGLLTLPQITMLGLLLAGIVGLFWQWIQRQHWHSMNAMSDWGHAYVIPLISGYLIWRERDQIVRTPVRTFWPGLLPFLLGIGAYFVSVVIIKNHMLQGMSIVLTIAGLALLLCGTRMFRLIFLPITYLLFAITISEMIMIKITFQLQLIASQGAGFLLALIGPLLDMTVEVDGNTLYVTPKGGTAMPLNVAEACSGMRMVVAFVALAGAVALISARHWWQRVAVLVLALPVAILMNVVRVAILGIATKYSGELAKGDAHMMIGTVLLVPGLMLFLGIVWALSKVVDDGEARTVAHTPPVQTRGWQALKTPAFVASIAAMAFFAVAMTAGIHYAGIHLRKHAITAPGDRKLTTLPTETPTWKQVGTDKLETAEVEETLGTKNYLTRTYTRKDRKPGDPPMEVQVHAAYYTGMVDTVPHVPERCFLGAGMEIGRGTKVVDLKLDPSGWSEHPGVDGAAKKGLFRQRVPNWSRDGVGSSVTLPRDPAGLKLRVTEFSRNGQDKTYAGYFFVANGGHVSSAEEVRLLAFDLRSDYAYYLKVQFTSRTVADEQQLADQASSLLNELLPDIMRCVPDWVEVEAGRYPARDESKNTP
ncbi:MAG: exosortase/archaeosortase family protein [Phycisphaerales bacterium]|nr:exosortase/archaeosortase family protein [Planctomycetota bacterium]